MKDVTTGDELLIRSDARVLRLPLDDHNAWRTLMSELRIANGGELHLVIRPDEPDDVWPRYAVEQADSVCVIDERGETTAVLKSKNHATWDYRKELYLSLSFYDAMTKAHYFDSWLRYDNVQECLDALDHTMTYLVFVAGPALTEFVKNAINLKKFVAATRYSMIKVGYVGYVQLDGDNHAHIYTDAYFEPGMQRHLTHPVVAVMLPDEDDWRRKHPVKPNPAPVMPEPSPHLENA